jgi:hypothetical protein
MKWITIETWVEMFTISAFVLAGILLVLLCLITLYEPAKKKAGEITFYAMIGLIIWWFLIVGIGMFFVVE